MKLIQMRLVGTVEQVCTEIKKLIYYYGCNAKLKDVIRKESKVRYVDL